MKRVVVLAVGVVLAGAGAIVRSGPESDQPTMSIEGPRAADLGPRATPPPRPEPPSPKPEAHLDLDKLQLVGDHYEAPLGAKPVALTLDPELQQLAEQLLDKAHAPRGAIVAMTPDGKILALAGRRSDDPKGVHDGKPDWRLATEAWAPAASVFKLVTASALVAAGVDPDAPVCYHGGIRSVLESNLRDDKRDNDCKSLAWGVAHSNNAIVGKLAFQHLQPATLAGTARDLFGEIALPMPARFGELELPDTHDLALAQAAAGFSGSKLSVLGGALLAATFANAGARPAARLVAEAADPGLHRVLPDAVARAVARMMVGTCRDGSAAKSFGRHATAVAGKTGTLARTEPFYMEHSWFVGYAPADHPQIVVSVLLGNPEDWQLRGQEAARALV
ncbi:MAG TPA: penicillin-binding transpeptidase domain-containing protein, partial [Kofleriaceae bacterium]|nr:penicillin-binding transpeptidase domain-containing protein [Kofleriaceae bacterium]